VHVGLTVSLVESLCAAAILTNVVLLNSLLIQTRIYLV
jgi:hypothetical protein